MQSDKPHDICLVHAETNNMHVVAVRAIIIIMLLYLITETWIVETCLNLGTELAMQLTTESEKASSIG